MRIRTTFLFILLSLSAFKLDASGHDPVASKGILDLRKVDNPEHFIIKLNGDWEFYWNKMLRPNDFKTGSAKPDYYGKVPSYWTDYPQESVKTDKFGYATYRLTVLFPKGFNKPLAIDLPVFDSSYDIYLNENTMEAMAPLENQLMKQNPSTGGTFSVLIPEQIRLK